MGRNDLCFCGSGKKHKKCHSSIESESVFADVFKLYKDMDIKVSNETQFEKLKCKKGCGECCYQHFSISSIEFYYILHNVLEHYGKDKMIEYINKGYEMWLQYESEYPDKAKLLSENCSNPNRYSKVLEELNKSPMFNKFPCPFLNIETQSCEVYEYRASICREYAVAYINKHSLPTAYCRHTADGVKYEDFMANLSELEESILDLNIYKSDKFQSQAVDRGYPMFYFCKIAHKDINNVMAKISEFRTLSKKEISDRKIGRAISR